MSDKDRDTYVAFHTVPDPDTWADRDPHQFVHDGMYFRKARLVSPYHPTESSLKATLYAAHDDSTGTGLSSAERDQVIRALIAQLNGVQDLATGTVVIDIPLGQENIITQLWIHEWE